MKKFFAVCVILLTVCTVNVFAFGVGAQTGYPLGGAITFKLDNVPCVFAANVDLGSYTAFGLTADWWIANPKIAGNVCYFYGLGLAGNFATTKEWSSFGFGPRLFLGTNLFILDGALELFLQGAWQPMFWINTSGNGGNAGFEFWNFAANIGFRFWFK